MSINTESRTLISNAISTLTLTVSAVNHIASAADIAAERVEKKTSNWASRSQLRDEALHAELLADLS